MHETLELHQELNEYAKNGRIFCWDFMDILHEISQKMHERAGFSVKNDEKSAKIHEIAEKIEKCSLEIMEMHFMEGK